MTTTDPETLFPPKPGGMVDTIRRAQAAEQAQLATLTEAERAPQSWSGQYTAVRVRETGAELARARTFSVATGGANPVVELLGQDTGRKYAVIMTLDQPVVICFSQQAADDPRNPANAAGLSANGFVLPVNVPVPFTYEGVIWCAATSSTPSRVSVMAFSYADPPAPGA